MDLIQIIIIYTTVGKNLLQEMDTTLMAESKEEHSLLKGVKEESEKAGLKLNIKKIKSWHLVPSHHSK